MAGQGKQAKVLTDAQVRRALSEIEHRRYPLRDRVMIQLSVRAGLRAKEIAMAKWGMVTDADGEVGDALDLTNKASKGRNGGRTIPLHRELRAALMTLKATRNVDADDRIIFSERTIGMSALAVSVWFHRLYGSLNLKGASSHSGRRTFVTRLAKKAVEAGGSLRDVQQLAGHASLQTTQRYIEGNSDAKKRMIDLL